ncbi:MAG: Gfo/Idh/MocA family oxidoreductase [Actinomycetota bacterium]|nr:Gfo/Idh/MocA family oxidoreductase [Actinomycetota bacterium]
MASSSGSPIRIAVAGGGYGSKVPLPVYSELSEFEPIGVWSQRDERASELASEAGLEVGTTSLDELLSAPGLEAVHVATPVALHEEFAMAVLERGLHLVCEKPLAGDLTGARRIAEAVRAAGVVCVVNYGRRMQEARERLLELVREVAGRPRFASVSLVHSDHADPDSRSFSWVEDAAMGGGRLQAYGVHDLDLLLEALGEVESVAAAADVAVPERPDGDGMRPVTAEDGYAIVCRPREGGIAVITMVSTARHGRGDVIEVYGEQGTVCLDAERRLWWGRAGEELTCEGPLEASSKDAFRRLALAFHAAVRHGEPPDPSLEEALRVQAFFDAVHQAAAERRWVEVERMPADAGVA